MAAWCSSFRYEGAFTAVGGPANGMLSTDIGVLEDGFNAVGTSLSLTGSGNTYADLPGTRRRPLLREA